ncbi:MAG: hypothetical protein GX858_03955 [Clostridiales bacterium]|nr:hypothetical protein [Clostridiales bacterium]
MTEIKWIKMVVNLFDNRKIKQISALPQGGALILLWFKLLFLAGSINDEGRVYLTREIPYTRQTLAGQFGHRPSLIKNALEVFAQFRMIEETDGVIRILNWEKYQSVEAMEKIREQTRQRVARHRGKERAVTPPCNVTVTQGNALEENLDKNLEEEGVLADRPPPAKKFFVPPTLDEVSAYCRERGNHVNPVKFLAHYETRGWMAGKNKMRSWQSAIISWEHNEFDKGAGEAEEVNWAIDR